MPQGDAVDCDRSPTIHLLLVATVPPPLGGVSVWCQRFIQDCPSVGIDVHLVDTKPKGRRNPFWLRPWFEIVRPARAIIRHAKHPRTIAHVCVGGGAGFIKGLVLAAICTACSMPVVVHLHSSLRKCHPALIAVARRMSKCPGVRFVTPNRSDSLASKFIEYIPNYVPDEFWQNRRVVICRPTDTLRLVYMGSIIREKGLFELVEAVSRVPGIVLDMYGPNTHPGQLEQLMRLTQELSLESRVRYCGEIRPSEVADTLCNYHALILPSHNESFGLVAAEAMMLGLPVIATKTGLLEWAPEHAFVCVGADAASIAAVLQHLLQSKCMLRTVGQRGQEYARSQYSQIAVMTRWRDLYRTIR